MDTEYSTVNGALLAAKSLNFVEENKLEEFSSQLSKTLANLPRATNVAVARVTNLAPKGAQLLARGGTRMAMKMATPGLKALSVGARILPRISGVLGPIGAVANVALWCVDTSFRKDIHGFLEHFTSTHTPKIDDPPTHPAVWLPLTADGNRDPIILDKDKGLTAVGEAFNVNVDADRLWNPHAPKFQAIADASHINVAVKKFTTKFDDAISSIQNVMNSTDSHMAQPMFEVFQAHLQKLVPAMATTVTSMTHGSEKTLTSAQNLFNSLLQGNSHNRDAIANSNTGLWPLGANHIDGGSMTDLLDQLKTSQDELTTAANSIVPADYSTFSAHYSTNNSSTPTTPIGTKTPERVDLPEATHPNPENPHLDTPTPTPAPATQPPQNANPQIPQMPNPQIPNPQIPQIPNSQMPKEPAKNLSAEDLDKLLKNKKDEDKKDNDHHKPVDPDGKDHPKVLPTVDPTQPKDKDHKIIPPVQKKDPREIIVAGVHARFPNQQIAKIAALMAPNDGSSPLPFDDAAQKAGITVDENNFGTEVPPDQITPGNLIVSNQGKGIIFNDHQVLVDGGKLVDLAQFAKFDGSDPHVGIFELPHASNPNQLANVNPNGADSDDQPANDPGTEPPSGKQTATSAPHVNPNDIPTE